MNVSYPLALSRAAAEAVAGTVTSVAGGVGITNTPEPIVGAGTVDLDINSLTSEVALAAGDLFPFVDVSVGTTPADQRKVTLANLLAGLEALGIDADTLDGLDSTAFSLVGHTHLHALLSATHTDTVANAVTRGSLIYGDATPAWNELVIGGANTILGSDGTDVAWRPQSFIDHGSLGGLTDDDHAGYLRLVGRTGTTNNPLLSTSTDGTITGSSVSGGALILDSTSHATVGTINALDELILRVNFPAPAAAATATAASFTSTVTLANSGVTGNILRVAPTGTISHAAGVSRFQVVDFEPTFTLSGASHQLFGFRMRGTVEFENTLSQISLLSCESVLFADDNGVAGPPNLKLVNLAPTMRLGGSGIGLVDDARGVFFAPVIETDDTADLTITTLVGTEIRARFDEAVGSSLTVTEHIGLLMAASTVVGSPAIGRTTAIQIQNTTAGGVNLSMYSIGADVHMRHIGPVRIGSDATPTQKLEVLGNILIDNSGTAGELRFREPSGSGSSYTGFKAPALAGNVIYTLPIADGASGDQLTTDGAGALSWAAAGGSASLGTHTIARFTGSDTRNATTVFANANDGTNTLQFAVAVSQTWVFHCVLRMEAPNATGDMKIQFTGPATVTAFAAGTANNEVGVADATHMNALSTSSGRISLVLSTNHTITIHGFIVTDGTNSGNVTLQWAQNTSNANDFFMRPTSFIHAQRIA